MSDRPTVLVLGRRKTDNMPSLTRMLEVLKPTTGPTVRGGMDATVTSSSSVRITGTTCPRMGDEALPDHCSLTGTQECPSDQAVIDTCPTC